MRTGFGIQDSGFRRKWTVNSEQCTAGRDSGFGIRDSQRRKFIVHHSSFIVLFLFTVHCALSTSFAATHITGTYDLGANPRIMTTVGGTAEYGLVFAQRNKAVTYGGVEYGPSVVKGYLNVTGQLNDGAGNLWLDLIPNAGAIPSDSYYVVTINIQGRVHAEIWVVPDVASVAVEAVRQVQPPGATSSGFDLASATGLLALAHGGTNQSSWTAARCVRVNNAGTQLESAPADCGTGGGSAPIASATVSGTVKTDTTVGDPVVYLNTTADTLLAGKASSVHTHSQNDVTNLTTDLAGKVPTTRNVGTSSPLAGGGALSSDLTLSCPTCEVTGNKNAASGYAGLSASSKITASQMQEVLSAADLTTYSGVSGNGSTALAATMTALATNDLLKWNGSNWVNAASAAKADALTNDPSDCGANNFATAIAASGNLTCAQPSTSNLSDGSNVVKNNQANTYSGGGLQDLSANRLALPAATTLPASCTANKEIYVDTDAAPAGQQVYLCNSTGNGWNLVGDGTGGGSSHALLSATHTDTLAGAAVLGGTVYANATPAWAQLAGNTTTTKKFLTQTGNGSISAVPGWNTIIAGDMQELLGVADLTDFASKSGSGTAALGATITSPGDNQCVTYDLASTTWINETCPGGGSGDSITVATVAATDPDFIDTATIDVTLATIPTPDTIAFDVIANSINATHIDETADYLFTKLSGKQDRNNTAVDDDCTGEQGLWWYDTTDSAFEFCNAASGIPTVLGGGAGGDNVSVNGVAATDADFDDATPAAEAGYQNIKWQKDALTPNNISAEIQPASAAQGGIVTTASQTFSGSKTVTNGYFLSAVGSTPSEAFSAYTDGLSGAGTRDGGWFKSFGHGYNTADHQADWIHFTDVTGQAGESQYTWQSRIDAAGYSTRGYLTDGGVFNAVTGYQVNGGATAGNVLRGNGTNFVSATLACADVTNCPSLVAAGTAGNGPSKVGDATTAARSNHDHRSIHQLAWFFPGTPATGVQNMTATFPETAVNFAILNFRVTVNTISAGSSTFNIQRCVVTGVACSATESTWVDIYSTVLTLAASNYTVAKGSAPDQNVASLTNGDRFRANLVTIGASLANVTVSMTVKYDTTN